jgi:hypothetical protein
MGYVTMKPHSELRHFFHLPFLFKLPFPAFSDHTLSPRQEVTGLDPVASLSARDLVLRTWHFSKSGCRLTDCVIRGTIEGRILVLRIGLLSPGMDYAVVYLIGETSC